MQKTHADVESTAIDFFFLHALVHDITCCIFPTDRSAHCIAEIVHIAKKYLADVMTAYSLSEKEAEERIIDAALSLEKTKTLITEVIGRIEH